MNILKHTKIILVFMSVSVIFFSCEKDYPTKTELESYQFSGLDEKGGTWKTVLLTDPEQIKIDAPQNINSTEYKSELESAKKIIGSNANVNNDWTNNPIIRWNEIARELAAKYNLTPAPNADGTYPAPSAANPGVYPYFPFAHPPYAARVFAYLSAAQFDGMISAWHYKFKYNRPAIHITDNTIKPFYPTASLPSYPSDGAVIAAVSRDILSAMFPLEKEHLKLKADEMKQCLISGGINVDSDIIAGDSLGRGIAKLYLSRASTDGMSRAQVSKSISDSIATAAFNRFGWKWQNMESPQRPVGIAPMYGSLKLWNVPNVEVVRPLPPPAIGSPEYKIASDELISIKDNLTINQRRIANWWSDGLGTYTPPGHWNRFATDYIIKYKMNPIRAARVYAYLNMAIHDAGISCWDAKYYYHYPRPIQVMPGYKTNLGTPNFPGYTSGHSTFSAAAASVLAYIFPVEKTQVDYWAKEASESRIYGGIHFRFDCEAGLIQGKKVAEYTLQKAMKDGAL